MKGEENWAKTYSRWGSQASERHLFEAEWTKYKKGKIKCHKGVFLRPERVWCTHFDWMKEVVVSFCRHYRCLVGTRGWQSLSLAYRTQILIAEYEHLTIITTAFLNSCSDLLHLLFGQLWNVTDAFIHSQLCWWADLSPGLLLRSVGESYKETTSASLSHLDAGYFQLEEFQSDAWCSLKHICMISLINTNAVCDFRFWCL